MAVFSKPGITFSDVPCTVLHPWADTCWQNFLHIWLASFRGSSKFFSFIYVLVLLQNVIKNRKLSPEIIQDAIKGYFRSCLFGAFFGGVSSYSICAFRNLLKGYSIMTMGMFPGAIGAAFLFMEHPSRRAIDITVFIDLVTDLYLNIIQQEGYMKLTLTMETLFFMVCSSALLFCLRAFKGCRTTLWPLIPPRVSDDPEKRKQCPHVDECWKDIIKAGSTYFTFGMVFQLLKISITHFKKLLFRPIVFWKILFRKENLMLPAFAGLYVTLYKGVSCLLRQYRGEDAAWHAVPAGLVAGVSYSLHPNMSLATCAFSNLVQVLCLKLRKALNLPDWYWGELAFMACGGFLFSARTLHPQCFPKYMLQIMDTATSGKSVLVYDAVDKYIIVDASRQS